MSKALDKLMADKSLIAHDKFHKSLDDLYDRLIPVTIRLWFR